jgi:hypothetical protein
MMETISAGTRKSCTRNAALGGSTGGSESSGEIVRRGVSAMSFGPMGSRMRLECVPAEDPEAGRKV